MPTTRGGTSLPDPPRSLIACKRVKRMIDSKLILSDKDHVKRELGRKCFDVSVIDDVEALLLSIRSLITESNSLNKTRNLCSRDPSVPAEDKRGLRERAARVNAEINRLKSKADELLYSVPNLPDPDAPEGADASSNVVVFQSQEHYERGVSEPATHWEVAGKLGILDAELAGRLSGSGFALFRGKGAKLLRALVNYCFSLHEDKYREILPPHLVTGKTLTYTGHLPRFAAEQYKLSDEDLWLIPTAEVPLTAAFADTVFSQGELPAYRMGYTLSFRRETSSGGKETRGLQRIHEFHKVELMKIAEPRMAETELRDLLADCERIIRDLKLRYRIVDLCAGDMGDKYARCFDIEVYAPGVKKWLEASSVGHFSDYQARRAGIKYTDEKGRKKYACTLNGSGVATPRVLAAIIETYQQPDGTVRVPDALVPFMGCDVIGRE